MRLHSYRDESHSRHFDLIGGGAHPWQYPSFPHGCGHFGRGLRLCAHGPLGPLGFFPQRVSMGQQASVGGPRAPRSSSGHLSMEKRPPPSEGKGGEAPSFTARFRLIEQASINRQKPLA